MRTSCHGVEATADLRARLLQVVTNAGITPNALSADIGATRGTIRFIIKGKIKSPSVDIIRAVSDRLEVSLDWLVKGQGPEPSAKHLQRAWRAGLKRETELAATGTEG